MSKMDNLRAMREAKFDANAKRTATTGAGAAKRPPVAPVAAVAAKPSKAANPAKVEVEDAAAEPEPELCGHRNMSGRTCTRERGHDAKSHRYS